MGKTFNTWVSILLAAVLSFVGVELLWSAPVGTLTADHALIGAYVGIGGNPAGTGAVRFSNNTAIYFHNQPNSANLKAIGFGTFGAGANQTLEIGNDASITGIGLGVPSPATTATTGFPYMPSMAGQASGTPTSMGGLAAFHWDDTNRTIRVYSANAAAWVPAGGGGWKNFQLFTSNGSFTPSGTSIQAVGWGAGGCGGGGGALSSSGSLSGGGGGGSGGSGGVGWAVLGVSQGISVSVTIGTCTSPGAGGACPGTVATDGANASATTLVQSATTIFSLPGGFGGAHGLNGCGSGNFGAAGNGGLGGTSFTGANLSSNGIAGNAGVSGVSATGVAGANVSSWNPMNVVGSSQIPDLGVPGAGGNIPGFNGGCGSPTNGGNGTRYGNGGGSGGGGTANNTACSGTAGGNGAPGAILVWY